MDHFGRNSPKNAKKPEDWIRYIDDTFVIWRR